MRLRRRVGMLDINRAEGVEEREREGGEEKDH